MSTTTFETSFGSDEALETAKAGTKTALGLSATFILAFAGVAGTSTGALPSSISSFVGRETQRGTMAPLPQVGEAWTQPVVVPAEASVVATDRDEVTWLKEHSGLTWEQLGKVFGVSRRAVHMWATGGRLNESNASRLREFTSIVREIESQSPGSSPDDVRARLLAVSADGMSIVGRLRSNRWEAVSSRQPSPDRLLGVTREPLRNPPRGTNP